ncbi:MAG: hypothetical protein IJV27_00505 [Prevotella sp.]|nr:hypothetical protein [Prevotella sp.]
MNKHRIINGILGLVCLTNTILHAITVYEDIVSSSRFNLWIYILAPLSVLGWAFLTFCFFYIDMYGITADVFKVIRRAKKIKKIRKNKTAQ